MSVASFGAMHAAGDHAAATSSPPLHLVGTIDGAIVISGVVAPGVVKLPTGARLVGSGQLSPLGAVQFSGRIPVPPRAASTDLVLRSARGDVFLKLDLRPLSKRPGANFVIAGGTGAYRGAHGDGALSSNFPPASSATGVSGSVVTETESGQWNFSEA